jgi:hypothetical protein
LRWHSDFVQNAVDPISNAQIVFQRFDVNISRRSAIASRMIWLTNLTTDASGSSLFNSIAVSVSSSSVHGTPGLQNLVERLRANAIKSFHAAEAARAARAPIRQVFSTAARKLAPDRIEKIVSRQHHRVFLRLDRQNLMLKNETAREKRQSGAIDFFASIETIGTRKELPDCAEKRCSSTLPESST